MSAIGLESQNTKAASYVPRLADSQLSAGNIPRELKVTLVVKQPLCSELPETLSRHAKSIPLQVK
eukprot:4391543-Amphidinium_carterae.1